LAGLGEGLSTLEGEESGYADAADAPSGDTGSAFAVGFASAEATEAASLAGQSTQAAYSVGNAIWSAGNSILSRIDGGYLFGGIGFQSPVAGAEFGVGVFFNRNNFWVGLEGYGYVGAGAFVGGGGWFGHGWGSSVGGWGGSGGVMVGYNFGPISIEGVYDPFQGETYLGFSAGEGFVWGGGIAISGPPPIF
jgi:hypothetical protein